MVKGIFPPQWTPVSACVMEKHRNVEEERVEPQEDGVKFIAAAPRIRP